MLPLAITDGRLLLRPPRAADVDQVLRTCQDPEVARWTTVPDPYRRTDAEDWVHRAVPAGWAAGTHLVWYAVRPGEPERVLASVGLQQVDRPGGTAEIGYWTAPEARGTTAPQAPAAIGRRVPSGRMARLDRLVFCLVALGPARTQRANVCAPGAW